MCVTTFYMVINHSYIKYLITCAQPITTYFILLINSIVMTISVKILNDKIEEVSKTNTLLDML